MTANLENTIQSLLDERKIPNATFYASDATGDVQYRRIMGGSSFEADAPPLSEDLYMWAASCTKLLTSISVMKLVEDGRLALDDSVQDVLPELGELKILTQMDPSFEYTSPKNNITYRQLLTHTSGLGYNFMHPWLHAWQNANPIKEDAVQSRFALPLLTEPGTAWSYSCSLDWAGLAVERVSGMKLGEFMEQNILKPAGVAKDAITFSPYSVPGAELVTMTERDADGHLKLGSQGVLGRPREDDHYGGSGLFMRGGEYLKILRSFLAEDEKVLKRATVAEMLRPQLTPQQKKSMNAMAFSNPLLMRVVSRQVEQGNLDHCLCGLVDAEGKPGWRGKGTVMWGGAPNITWTLDRETGWCGLQTAQLMPSGDPTYLAVSKAFETTMHELMQNTQ